MRSSKASTVPWAAVQLALCAAVLLSTAVRCPHLALEKGLVSRSYTLL